MNSALRSLYDGVQSSVLVDECMTEWFAVNTGLRQGCMLSPILFVIVIDELAREVKRTGKGVMIGNTKINILLYADDIVLIAENSEDLQYLLDVVYTFSTRWGILMEH